MSFDWLDIFGLEPFIRGRLQYLSGLRHDVGVDLDGLGAEGVGVAIGWVPGKEGQRGGKRRVLGHWNRKESGTDGATKWRRRWVFGVRKTFMATNSFVFIETSLVKISKN